MDTTRMEPNDVQEELEIAPETMEPSGEGGAIETTSAGETSGRKWLWIGITVAVLIVGGIAIAVLASAATNETEPHGAVGVNDRVLKVLHTVVAHALGKSQQRLFV